MTRSDVPDVIPILVVLDTEAMADTVRTLRAAGMTVDEELPDIGTVRGWVPAGKLHDMQGLDGVLAVEPERTVRLPPPDSDLQ